MAATSSTNPNAKGFRLQHAARVLHQGGIVAYPTEAVYGLGCDPLNAAAVYRLLDLKQRPVDKGLILIAANAEQLRPFIDELPAAARQRVEDSWPGPATWVCPARPETPHWLTGRHDSLAVRVTAHPLAAALCAAFGGPVVSTSANTTGHPPACNALQARLRCPGSDLILHGPTGAMSRPTAIRDALSGALLRAG